MAHNVAVVLPEALTEPEAGVGTESVRLGGSFWIRLRLEKAVAGPGVRGQDDRDKWKQTSFFLGIQRRRLAPKVRPWEARFGPELDWEKLWRDQVFGAKMTETNGNKLVFFLGIQRQRLAPKVRPWEARFGPELDWEKLWRDQVFGAKMTETNGNKLLFF